MSREFWYTQAAGEFLFSDGEVTRLEAMGAFTANGFCGWVRRAPPTLAHALGLAAGVDLNGSLFSMTRLHNVMTIAQRIAADCWRIPRGFDWLCFVSMNECRIVVLDGNQEKDLHMAAH